MEEITQIVEAPAVIEARRAAWANRVIPPAPLTVEELFDMLVLKGVVSDGDRPRGRP